MDEHEIRSVITLLYKLGYEQGLNITPLDMKRIEPAIAVFTNYYKPLSPERTYDIKWPGVKFAHTHASENADVYYAHEDGQKEMLDRCKSAVANAGIKTGKD